MVFLRKKCKVMPIVDVVWRFGVLKLSLVAFWRKIGLFLLRGAILNMNDTKEAVSCFKVVIVQPKSLIIGLFWQEQ